MKKFASLLLGLFLLASAHAEGRFSGKEAWLELEETLVRHYVYLHDAGFDARAFLYRAREGAEECETREAFLHYARTKLRHFHDPHLNLFPLRENDPSVIPTGSDIWGVKSEGAYQVQDVKRRSAAYRAGVRPGMVLLEVDGEEIPAGVERLMGSPLSSLSPEQENFALNILLGGKRHQARRLLLSHRGTPRLFQLEASYADTDRYKEGPPVFFERRDDIGYIRFENSLGRSDTAAAFKKALTELLDTRALVLDLRNIPSGGNTGVARPILGHFTRNTRNYQLYQFPEYDTPYYKMPYIEDKVTPQEPFYSKPVIAMAGRWTGSMGEGVTVGLEALGVKAVVGSPLADLLGGIEVLPLKSCEGTLELPVLRIYDIHRQPREKYLPPHLLIPADTDTEGGDPAFQRALKLLRR